MVLTSEGPMVLAVEDTVSEEAAPSVDDWICQGGTIGCWEVTDGVVVRGEDLPDEALEGSKLLRWGLAW